MKPYVEKSIRQLLIDTLRWMARDWPGYDVRMEVREFTDFNTLGSGLMLTGRLEGSPTRTVVLRFSELEHAAHSKHLLANRLKARLQELRRQIDADVAVLRDDPFCGAYR